MDNDKMMIYNYGQNAVQPLKKGEVVLYQPTEDVRIEARLVYETIWLTQQQIAELFGTKRPAITKHISNIYTSGELEKEGTCSILEHMGNEGKQRYTTLYYNSCCRLPREQLQRHTVSQMGHQSIKGLFAEGLFCK